MRSLVILCCGFVFLMMAGIEVQGQKKEDLPKFLKNLTAKDPKDRIDACQGIAEIGELKKVYAKDAVDPLCNVLRKDDDAKVRQAAAAALGRIEADAEKATPALIGGLKDKDPGVQAASANAIAAIGSGAKAAGPVLKELNDQAKAEAAKAREEATKAKADGDKDKERIARQKAQAAQQIFQATNAALKSIGGQ
jgi:HEAT repeat protein